MAIFGGKVNFALKRRKYNIIKQLMFSANANVIIITATSELYTGPPCMLLFTKQLQQ